MRRLAWLAFLIALLGSASPAPPANYDAFGFTLLEKLGGGSGNVFVSPLSIGVALSMAADGAKGATQAALRHALRASDESGAPNAALTAELQSNADAKVGVANALWTRADAPPDAPYAEHLANVYGAHGQALKFGEPSAAATMNAWVKAHTLGLIGDLIGSTSASDVLYLTNAVAFEGKWTVPFEKGATAPKPFTGANGSAHDVEMMSRDGNYETATGDSARMLRMPYGKGGFAAYVVIPNDANAIASAAPLDAERFEALRTALASKFVHVEMPRFTASYRASLIPALKALGLGVAFSPGADFTGMRAAPPRLEIGSVEHASYVRVDEEGTVAAAATSIGMRAMAMRMPSERFIVDRPFAFVIRDEVAGAILFAGTIRDIPAVEK